MNIKQLEIFVTIAATGSFSKGAEAACVTQSTASQHIATLEESCGVRLLDRTGRGAVTTEAGKIMLTHARQVIKSLKDTEQAILRFRQADGVELSVGGSTIPGTYLLPKAIAALRASDPGIRVKVEIGDSSDILARLIDENIEIAGSEAIKQAVLAECGIAFISELAVRGELKRGELVSINLSGIAITRSFSLVHRKGRTVSPAATAFSAMLRRLQS